MKTGIDYPRTGTESGSEPAALGTVRRYLAENYRSADGTPLGEPGAARISLRRITMIEHGVRRLCRARDVGDEIARMEGLVHQDGDDEGDGW
ncbi:hypothetical protein F4553_003018 [Allocatelliglobosispora scoriae]|uniref:Uncharacterized protein n=1 Tax=Allocatelliglobosispora scoriae TaxID=643052 RepID=A0A841BR20_9ACTN|nr:hypothetical protein [Allocatelliglobosispora scoriae]MBB5869639.1 hypothetical protein [Allocatelliglobosispora scoriae]